LVAASQFEDAAPGMSVSRSRICLFGGAHIALLGKAREESIMAKRWYIVHAYSNFEKKVAESIKERAKAANLGHLFDEVLVPSEDVIEVRRGRKVHSERKLFPSYVLVKMEMTDQAFLLIKNTPKVTGFLGADNKATPISEDEAMRILNQVKEGVERPKPSVSYEIGEQVKVSDGPFASFSGQVEEVDEERSRLKVAVMIFGRPTRVDLEFGQVEKVAS
jgi:transcription termination/antitermination protein NusG